MSELRWTVANVVKKETSGRAVIATWRRELYL